MKDEKNQRVHPSPFIAHFCFKPERVCPTVKLLRPRFRRAASTLRPPLVCMRLRKPCVRVRFNRLG